MKSPWNEIGGTVIVTLVVVCVYLMLSGFFNKKANAQDDIDLTSQVFVYYSPSTDLEAIDLKVLSQAKQTIDASEYSLTDDAIAKLLLQKANEGVHIRIYRDLRQYEGEVSRPNSNMTMFTGNKFIQVRVKHSSILAHLKSYCVDCHGEQVVVRDGSANWSEEGEKQQDNSLILMYDRKIAEGFEADFEAMWNRPDNKVIQ